MVLGKRKDSDDPSGYIARKDFKKAISLIRERLSRQPQNSSHRLTLADTLLLASQTDEAVSEYKILAEQYTREGFLVKAIAIYKKVLKLRPGDPGVAQLLADLTDKYGGTSTKSRSIASIEFEGSEDMELGNINFPAAPAVQQEPEMPVVELGSDAIVASEPPVPQVSVESEMKLFRNLSREEFRDVVARMTLRFYEEDTIVVQEGDPGDSMYVVVRGEVRVTTRDNRQKEVVLANLGEGEFFGEVALLTGRPRTATIITNLNSELLELTREDFEEISSHYPHVRTVMEEFHRDRAYKTVEAMIQAIRDKS